MTPYSSKLSNAIRRYKWNTTENSYCLLYFWLPVFAYFLEKNIYICRKEPQSMSCITYYILTSPSIFCIPTIAIWIYLMTSCIKTVFIDSSYKTGCFLITILMSTGKGTRSRILLADSSITWMDGINHIKYLNVIL